MDKHSILLEGNTPVLYTPLPNIVYIKVKIEELYRLHFNVQQKFFNKN